MPARCLIRGSINVDEFFHVKDIVRPGETISSEGLEKRAGGKGANQAVAVTRAGAQADLVASIGSDGKWVKAQLKAAGVNVDGVVVVDDLTGRAIIQLSQEGENSIILYKGANYSLVHERNPFPRHPGVTHVLLQNEIPFSETLAQLYAANDPSLSKPLTTLFNPSPMPTKEQLLAFPWEKLSWLVVNEGEASDLNSILTPVKRCATPHLPNPPHASMSAYPTILHLSQCIPSTNIICTLGGAGVMAHIPSFKGLPIYLPAAKLQGSVRDSTGAGDCFTGYLVAGLMDLGDMPLTAEILSSVLRRCVQAAGMCVERRGAMESIPASRDVAHRLASSPV